MADDIKPDQFGWFRVLDRDSGHKLSLRESQLAHGNYQALKEAASDPNTGNALPPEHNAAKVAAPTSGQSAGNEKES